MGSLGVLAGLGYMGRGWGGGACVSLGWGRYGDERGTSTLI